MRTEPVWNTIPALTGAGVPLYPEADYEFDTATREDVEASHDMHGIAPVADVEAIFERMLIG